MKVNSLYDCYVGPCPVSGDTQWRSSLRHCVARQKVSTSIDLILPAVLCLESTQLLTEVSGICSGGGGCKGVGLTTLVPSCADYLSLWELHPPGNPRLYRSLSRDCFTLPYAYQYNNSHLETGLQSFSKSRVCQINLYRDIVQHNMRMDILSC